MLAEAIVWMLTIAPNLRLLLVSRREDLALKILGAIKRTFESNAWYIAEYGEQKPDLKDSDMRLAWAATGIIIASRTITGSFTGAIDFTDRLVRITPDKSHAIVAALNGYKSGDRKHPSMRGVAGSMSDQDMADVAAYYERLGKEAGAPAVPETAEPPPALTRAFDDLQGDRLRAEVGRTLPGVEQIAGQRPVVRLGYPLQDFPPDRRR